MSLIKKGVLDKTRKQYSPSMRTCLSLKMGCINEIKSEAKACLCHLQNVLYFKRET